MALTVFLLTFGLMFILGYPIVFAMITGGILYFLVTGLDLSNLIDILVIHFSAQDVLIAVPLFIFTANVMNDCDITRKLFDFIQKAMGRIRGGLGYANIVASIIFAGMSGSEIADVSGIGNIEIKAMMDAGYDGKFACAVTAASATIGPIIPPSIPMVIYSMLTGASLGYLFLAGFLPGFLLGMFEMIMVYILSRVRNYPRGEKVPLPMLVRAFGSSLPALLAPAILLIGIYGGIFTATEAAAVVAGYVIIISFLIYKSLGWKKLYKILMKSAESVGYISFIVASAYIVTYVVAREHVAQQITEAFIESGLLSNKILLLLSINLLYFILGMFIDVSIIQLVVIPMIFPLVQAAGIDPVHFGIITTVNLMMALDTPPYGQTGYITSALSGTPLREVFKEMLKYWIPVEVAALMVITFWPDFVLFLPRLFGYSG
ncbi:MAG: TRAP transporter large permease [Thermotogae bacterium]|nr:TRAP transporter large permease [Thermotogota bacterium]RKX46423.1 MAG: TRAP transporter large permease [Thermotogota bacterium]RLG29635.1 MAG: TRAP transporter large permease [Methanosarcinales archaeon]